VLGGWTRPTGLCWERDAAGRGALVGWTRRDEALLVGWTDPVSELKQEGTLIDTLLADHGLYHLEADLRWSDHTAARLDLHAEKGCAERHAVTVTVSQHAWFRWGG
jgi:hypothetical protein